MPAKPPALRYSHDAMIDMIIAEPHVSQAALAKRFGYTRSWVSTIMTSDAFKAKLALRRDEVVDPILKVTLEERFRALTTRSLEILQEKLEAPASMVPDQLVLRAMELGAKSLGLGAAPPLAAPSADHIEQLAGRLLALQRTYQPGLVVEAEIINREEAA